MSIPFLSPSRCVLLIGDEALCIYNVGATVSKLVETVPWGAPNFEQAVSGAIKKECNAKSVLVLYDMVEQHYRKERMPKVSPLDKANVVERKLQMAFANYPVRAALPLKAKVKKTQPQQQAGGGAAHVPMGGVYLFAAIPGSEAFVKTIDSVRKSMAPISAFCLLPVESSGMVKTLAAKLSKKAKTKSKWAVFVGQHRNGGLRQIVTKDGELALTRMTPIVDTDIEPELWTKEVAQEFKATMSYLSRFGYSPDEGLEVIVIANPAAGDRLGEKIDVPCNYTSMTVMEAAKLLGIKLGPQEDPRYADPLHAAWSGRRSNFILPMKSGDITKVHRPRQIAMAASLLLVLGAGYLMFQMFNEVQAYLLAQEDLDNAERRKRQVVELYNEEVARKQAMGFDVQLVQGTLDTYKDLQEDSAYTLPFIKDISVALGPQLIIDSISYSTSLVPGPRPEVPSYDEMGNEIINFVPREEARLTMSFPSSLDPDFVSAEYDNLMVRLRKKFKDYNIVSLKNPVKREYTDTLEGQTGVTQRVSGAAEDYLAEIEISGVKK